MKGMEFKALAQGGLPLAADPAQPTSVGASV